MDTFTQDQLTDLLGPIDVYLLDQVMKGNLQPGMKILDAGCGHGRNLYYFVKTGYEVHAVDQNLEYMEYVRKNIREIDPDYPIGQIRLERIEDLSYKPDTFDLVISLAVLHFAPNPASFDAMMESMWQVLKPGGLLFIRCASDVGMQGGKPLGHGRWLLPDGSERYLLTMDQIDHYLKKWSARQVEPIKTTNVQEQRWMTTWVLLKEKDN